MAEHWMQGARESIEKRGTKGVFKKAAEKAGMSTPAYAAKKSAESKHWRAKHPGEKEPHAMAVAAKRAGLAKAFAR